MGKRSGIGSKKTIVETDPLEMMDNLFSMHLLDIFDGSDNLAQDIKDVEEELPEALIYRDHRPTKRELKAVASNQYLHQVLMGLPEPNTTWYCISNSRFNFFSFIPSVIKYLGDYTTILYCATWTTNNINTKELVDIFDQGKIGAITFVVGKYFQAREQAVYNYLASHLLQRQQRLIVGEHHLKVLLLHNQDHYIVIESSANLTSNPRTEQFTYSNDQSLFNFYKQWFEGLTQGKVA